MAGMKFLINNCIYEFDYVNGEGELFAKSTSWSGNSYNGALKYYFATTTNGLGTGTGVSAGTTVYLMRGYSYESFTKGNLVDDGRIHTLHTIKYSKNSQSPSVTGTVYDDGNGNFPGWGQCYDTDTGAYVPQYSYTVTYDANGGSGAPSAQTKYYGTNLTLSSTTPTRTGHTFVKWEMPGIQYFNPGDTYGYNQSVILYAVWEPVDCVLDVNCLLDNTEQWSGGNFGTFEVYLNGDKQTIDGKTNLQDFYSNTVSYGTQFEIKNVTASTGYTYNGVRDYGIENVTTHTSSNGTVGVGINYIWLDFSTNSYNLDVNGCLDGSLYGDLKNYGTFDVYINDNKEVSGVNDYNKPLFYNTKFEIKNINATTGHSYRGVLNNLEGKDIPGGEHWASAGPISGTMGTSIVWTFLEFVTNKVNIHYLTNGGTVSSRDYQTENTTISSGSGAYDGIVIKNKSTGSSILQTNTYGCKPFSPLSDAELGLEKTGYDFKGWKLLSSPTVLSPNGTYESFDYSDCTGAEKTTKNTEIVTCYLEAQWELKSYTINYDYGRDDLTNPSTQTKIYGEPHTVLGYYPSFVDGSSAATELTIPTNVPNGSGWHMNTASVQYVPKLAQVGWKTPSEATYDCGDEYTTNSGTTFSAVWEPMYFKFTLPAPAHISGYEFKYYNLNGALKYPGDEITYSADGEPLTAVYELLATISNVKLQWENDTKLKLYYDYNLEDNVDITTCLINIETGISNSMSVDSVETWSTSYTVDKSLCEDTNYVPLNIPQLENGQFLHIRAYVEENNKKHSCISKYMRHTNIGYTVGKIENTLVSILEDFIVGELENAIY